MARKERGFTLIEMMAAVLVFSILAALAAPSFKDLIEKTRVRTAMESFSEAFRIARLTAVQERTKVAVCPLNDGTTCSGANWSNGVMVVKTKPDNSTEVIQKLKFSDQLFVTKNNPAANDKIEFTEQGWAKSTMSSIFFCSEEGNKHNGYRLKISFAGQLTPDAIPSDSNCASAS